ncbi:CoA-disulfide reductase [Brumimicrobium salinarum]|uniref:CoA-disulfide reductase n=1 Tax=Brumimicrobium salinarum TaxID=2058658 RepID=A0A2I0R672_9FLAO|nr:FAD-dependent oxidoreductase [Brumimicrobium salinarum]PKR82065.1 CoA-disulfide reductase [Brumimicrobium salinarum]
MKYIIIGAVAGGASTAARIRRLDETAEIIMIEKGDYVSYANCGLPYYIGDVIQDRNKLFIQDAASFKKRFNIEVKVKTEAIEIHPAEKKVSLLDLDTQQTYTESYDKLVLSTGAVPIKPPIPGIHSENVFTLRNVHDTDLVKSVIEHKEVKHATVVGGGFIGIEMMENLTHLGIKTRLIERAPQVLTFLDEDMAQMAKSEMEANGVTVDVNNGLSAIINNADGSKTILLENGTTFKTDLVILSIGVQPNHFLAKAAGLEIGEKGGVLVDEFMQTSNTDIYAVGDVIEFHHPVCKASYPIYLAGPANKQGRICANNIVNGNTKKFKGSVSTTIVKVFGKTIGATGSNSRMLTHHNIKHITSVTHGSSNAGYYPGATQMIIKIAFNPKTGVLLGAQVMGDKGVDKRIDVFSIYVQNKQIVEDLMEFEQAYAPPFSSAKDPVNMAGFVANNIMDKVMPIFNPIDALQIGETEYLLDVRTPKEYEEGTIPNALNIELDELRNQLDQLPKNQTIYIFCQVGLRGYLASRILMQNGFDVKNLSGGYKYWKNTYGLKLETLETAL